MVISSRRLRRKLVLSSCLVATGGFLAFAAQAQTVTSGAATATGAAAAAASEVQEVVVTAERRSANLQRTALAITAVGGAQLDKSFINNLAGLNATVPSLEITKASGFENLVTIRGVGSETPENSLTTSPGVSLFIDGVYISNTISLDQTLFDVDHIEVLRGPQGALYGQSSIGGAINILTNQPKLHEFSGAADFSAGNYNLFRERAEVNVPLGDNFAARLSVQKYDHDGFTKDLAIPGFKLDEAHDVSGKVALLWKPTDYFSATLTGQWYHADQNGDAQKNIIDPATDPRELYQDYPGKFKLDTQLYHLNLEWDLPWFALKSITAYQNLDHVQQEDSSRSTFAILHAVNPLLGYDDVAGWNTTVHNLSEEFDVLSLPGTKLDWIGGIFIQHQTSHQLVEEFEGTTPATPADLTLLPVDPTMVYPSNLNYGNDSHATHDSYAVFVQGTYHITSNFRLTAGARYNMDANADPSFNFSGFGNGFAPPNATWDAVPTWLVRFEYDVTPDNMLYLSQSRGYKPGGSNGDTSAFVVQPTFEPETNTSFEVGSKNYFFDKSLRINVSAFYYIHKNFQYIETDPVPFAGGMANIPSVHDYGVEFEGSYVGLDNHLTLDLNLAYDRGEVNGVYKTIDSTVANYLEGPTYSGGNSDGFDAAHAYGACAYYVDYGGVHSPAAVNCYRAVVADAVNIQGKTPPAMPAVSGSFSASYKIDTPFGPVTPRVEVVYRGEEWARIFNDPALDKVPAYTVTNFNVDYVPTGTQLRLSVAVTNAFNVAGVNSRYTDPYGTGQTSQQYIPPQQFIGTIAYKF
jgi:iron complex outermembrane receptor protein